jgi:hypothetical protein
VQARASQLAALAVSELSEDPQRSIQDAYSALEFSQTKEGETALRQALYESHVRSELRGHSDAVRFACFSPD